ncbi:hypothetical protein V6N11_010958 [Hibiscus sabdariffa]|uniref:Uncharacterized protein n=1 Tax=Hibiscus sabdariffa TaxID=183260 RepID=A0ABR2S7G4_9ROSI
MRVEPQRTPVMQCVEVDGQIPRSSDLLLSPENCDNDNMGAVRSDRVSMETLVPDSFDEIESIPIDRIWKANVREDLRVLTMDIQGWGSDESVGLVQRITKA